MLAHNGRKTEALRLYLSALLHGCYRPRLSVIIFLQIFLNSRNYRALANTGIGWLRMGLRDSAGRKRSSNKPLKIA